MRKSGPAAAGRNVERVSRHGERRADRKWNGNLAVTRPHPHGSRRQRLGSSRSRRNVHLDQLRCIIQDLPGLESCGHEDTHLPGEDGSVRVDAGCLDRRFGSRRHRDGPHEHAIRIEDREPALSSSQTATERGNARAMSQGLLPSRRK